GEHGVGDGRSARARGLPGVRDARELPRAQVSRRLMLHLRPGPVRCQRRHGRPAHPPDGDHRRHPPGKPVLRTARRIPVRAAGTGRTQQRRCWLRGPRTMEPVSDETRTLRRTMRDLVALSALPAVWAGYQPRQVAEGLAEVLLSTLRLDLVYLRLPGQTERQEIEVARTAGRPTPADETRNIGRALAPC